MSKLNDLMLKLCPDGVEYEPIKKVFTRLRGTAITASKMKEIANPNGDIRIFAGGKTVINAFESDIPKANIISVSAVLVQSRGVIDFVFYEKPFTFKNEMWAYTHDNRTSVKFLYYVLKNNVKYFRDAASGMGSLPQISLAVTEDFKIPVPPLEVQREIVRILDNFTKLTVELTAELTARRKRYRNGRKARLKNFSLRRPATKTKVIVGTRKLNCLYLTNCLSNKIARLSIDLLRIIYRIIITPTQYTRKMASCLANLPLMFISCFPSG